MSRAGACLPRCGQARVRLSCDRRSGRYVAGTSNGLATGAAILSQPDRGGPAAAGGPGCRGPAFAWPTGGCACLLIFSLGCRGRMAPSGTTSLPLLWAPRLVGAAPLLGGRCLCGRRVVRLGLLGRRGAPRARLWRSSLLRLGLARCGRWLCLWAPGRGSPRCGWSVQHAVFLPTMTHGMHEGLLVVRLAAASNRWVCLLSWAYSRGSTSRSS